MTDKFMAVLALATMIVFLGVVAWFVPEIDLIAVIALVSLLAIYDFWDALRNKGTQAKD
jgi:prepilin signal peptidase PulO-like enzyme (type II secretory pathway)